jgi:hypothetical protein
MPAFTRFLEREILTLHGARSYAKRPAARGAVTPLYSAGIGEPAAKRSRTAGPRGYGEPLPGLSAPGAGKVQHLYSLLAVAPRNRMKYSLKNVFNSETDARKPKIIKKAFTVPDPG